MTSDFDLKEALSSVGEEWSPVWQRALEFSPAWIAAYIDLRRVPAENQVLPRKIQELVLLAMDAQCTHLYSPGIEAHTRAALKAGATTGEIVETLELSSVLGVHALAVGAPILANALEERGLHLMVDLNDKQQRIKSRFEQEKGYWNERFEPILRLHPTFFAAYTKYSALPFQARHSHLELKYKELIYCAIDCATTHLFEPGLNVHVRQALDHGALAEEIMEVFELATLMGAQTFLAGTEALTRELKHQSF